MKAIVGTTIYYIFIMMTAILAVTSCKDDEEVDQYDKNYVFVYAPGKTGHELTYLADGTFRKQVDETETLVSVRCTKPAPDDITVTFSIDGSAVDTYNSQYGTDYVLLESARLEKTTLTIKKGEYISADSLRINYTDMEEFQNGTHNYILPITISEIQGGGVELSKNRTFFLTYESSLLLLEITSSPVGTIIADKSAWSYVLNGGTTTLSPCEYIADGDVLDIDMGTEVEANTIALSYYAWYYASAGVKVAVSADGVNYENLGSVDFTDNSDTHYVCMLSPKRIRYIRITSVGYYYSSSWGAYITGVNVYTVE